MGYLLLIVGVALWAAAHFFKRYAPDRRAAMGEAGKGAVTAALALAILAMIFGYRWADPIFLWQLPSWAVHLNNLLMLIAFYLFAASGAKSRVTRTIRHPQLTGFIIFTAAHLLVNGDLPSLILFGGLLLWATAEIVVLNRETAWERPPIAPIRKEITTPIAALVVFAVVALLHGWLGPWPFGG
ncbi:NnrU family protein [Aestuariibius sp. 2305UL40-4]|uniref:NnrU family protein n=1 Tax=Aestuariibius violaceus TaxID=3234132 RepID=UPI00345EA565